MKLSSTSRASRVVVVLIGAAVALSLLAPVAAHAQDAADEFEDIVSEQRDATAATLEEVRLAMFEGSSLASPEQTLIESMAPNMPRLAAALESYVATLESLDAPADYSDDVALQVAALRELIISVDEGAAAASVGDIERVVAVDMAQAAILAGLAADLDPSYFDLAFVSILDDDFRQFVGVGEDEEEYLAGVVAAREEFDRRNRNFGSAFTGQYASSAGLMNALYEAGAGEAKAAVERAALALEVPERFADEHAWWLRNLEAAVAIDRLIGENARDGDATAFIANNVLLGLSAEPLFPELDPAFGSALAPGSPAGKSIDPAAAELGGYGQELFDLLRRYSFVDPSGLAAEQFFFPGVGLDEKMPAVAEHGDVLNAAFSTFADDLAALTPPAAVEAGHARLALYFDEQGANLASLLGDAAAGDDSRIMSTIEAMRVTYCSAASDLDGPIATVTSVHFNATLDECAG